MRPGRSNVQLRFEDMETVACVRLPTNGLTLATVLDVRAERDSETQAAVRSCPAKVASPSRLLRSPVRTCIQRTEYICIICGCMHPVRRVPCRC